MQMYSLVGFADNAISARDNKRWPHQCMARLNIMSAMNDFDDNSYVQIGVIREFKRNRMIACRYFDIFQPWHQVRIAELINRQIDNYLARWNEIKYE